MTGMCVLFITLLNSVIYFTQMQFHRHLGMEWCGGTK